MVQFLLINLDEFNQISPQIKQGFLKNLLAVAGLAAIGPSPLIYHAQKPGVEPVFPMRISGRNGAGEGTDAILAVPFSYAVVKKSLYRIVTLDMTGA